MEFDDVTQTGELPAQDEPELTVPRREPLPWVLLAVVAVVALAAIALLWSRASSESARADDAVLGQAKAEAELAAKTTEALDAAKRADELDTQLKALTAQRDGLLDQVKALEAKGATAAPAEPTKAAVKPVKAVKKKKSTKRRRR